MRWYIHAFFVAGSALFVACGNEDGSSDDMDMSQNPSTTVPEGGAGQVPGVTNGANDAGADSGSALPSGRDSGAGNGSADAGRPLTGDSGVSDAGRGDSGGGGADASVSDAASADTGAASGDSPCPSDGSPCKILPLGDSITYGLGVSDNASYRVELYKKAVAAKQKITFVGSLQSGPSMVDGMMFPRNNEGHSGWTISQVAGLIPSPALTNKPHIVLLMAGTNDMYVSPGPADAPKRLGMLLDKLTAADPQMFIVVAQITPATSYAAAVKTFNAAVPAIVQERITAGKHIKLVDMNTGFPMGALADGVHPSAPGYTFMAGVWYDAIKQWLH
jgi:lysophospholipase L1-like esterase